MHSNAILNVVSYLKSQTVSISDELAQDGVIWYDI